MQYDVKQTAAWVTWPMLVAFVGFGSMPLWIEAIGLYQYLAVEILIWVIFAMGFNLLLGYSGLPSFGHGAFFGIGAYAFGLAQFNVWPNLWFCLAAAVPVTAAIGGVTALILGASTRHLFCADVDRGRSDLLFHRLEMDDGHGR